MNNSSLENFDIEKVQSDVANMKLSFVLGGAIILLAYLAIKPIVWKLSMDSYLKREDRATWKFWLKWKYHLKFLAITLSILLIDAAAFLLIRWIINPDYATLVLAGFILPLHLFFANNANALIAMNESYLESFRKAYSLIKRIYYYIIPTIIFSVVLFVLLFLLYPIIGFLPVGAAALQTIIAVFYFIWVRYYMAAIVHKLKDKA